MVQRWKFFFFESLLMWKNKNFECAPFEKTCRIAYTNRGKFRIFTLSKAMTPGSFLPLRNCHTTEAPWTMLTPNAELDSVAIVLHAIPPTTVTLYLFWLISQSILAKIDAPLKCWLDNPNFTGPIHIIFCLHQENT